MEQDKLEFAPDLSRFVMLLVMCGVEFCLLPAILN